MDALCIMAIILAVAGIIGGLVPVMPGPPISWVALLLVHFSDKAQEPVSVLMLSVCAVIAVLLSALDYILPGIMSRMTGGSKSARKGAEIGLVIGIIFTPIGMLMGSFLGALLAEMFQENKPLLQALAAAAGAFAAFILNTGLKLIYSGALLWIVFVHIF